ncbi:MAG: hypothetical protein IJU72_09595, partial [Bacteroidales bacterium]|nr:hypothetical protein [Bacteroidales bacterium]
MPEPAKYGVGGAFDKLRYRRLPMLQPYRLHCTTHAHHHRLGRGPRQHLSQRSVLHTAAVPSTSSGTADCRCCSHTGCI